MESTVVNEEGDRDAYSDKVVESVCPYCGVGCQTEVHVKDEKILYVDGKNGPANENRLCVKGRFGFDYINHDGRLTKPLVRKSGVNKDPNLEIKDADIYDYFEETTWDDALSRASAGFLNFDPGIGFGKNLKHNMNLISNISVFHSLGFPILIGMSRKRFIKDISRLNDSKFRLGGTVSSSLFAMMQGVQVLRVHDVNVFFAINNSLIF
jgi:anaerobic selenocysteine-containing dehydrogenase